MLLLFLISCFSLRRRVEAITFVVSNAARNIASPGTHTSIPFVSSKHFQNLVRLAGRMKYRLGERFDDQFRSQIYPPSTMLDLFKSIESKRDQRFYPRKRRRKVRWKDGDKKRKQENTNKFLFIIIIDL